MEPGCEDKNKTIPVLWLTPGACPYLAESTEGFHVRTCALKGCTREYGSAAIIVRHSTARKRSTAWRPAPSSPTGRPSAMSRSRGITEDRCCPNAVR